MHRFASLARLCGAIFLIWPLAGHAQPQAGPSGLCRSAIAMAEAERHIPDAFLAAIARVESGRSIGGMVVAWPWTINAEGVGSFFASKEDAIAAVRTLQARGVRSIDVGCMQVNLNQHPDAFQSLDQAFDPPTNARYAAGMLVSLFGQMGSWPLAAAAYHSQTPTIGAAYQRQVLAAWALPDRPASDAAKKLSAAAHAPPAGPAVREQPATVPPGAIASSGAASGAAFGRQSGIFAATPPRAGIVRGNGRSLADYRQVPIPLAFRLPPKAG
jgi:hypothetical protein